MGGSKVGKMGRKYESKSPTSPHFCRRLTGSFASTSARAAMSRSTTARWPKDEAVRSGLQPPCGQRRGGAPSVRNGRATRGNRGWGVEAAMRVLRGRKRTDESDEGERGRWKEVMSVTERE